MTDLTRPLDLDHPGADAFLQGIQGDIIKGHGRVRTAHILLAMTGDPAAVRSWVADFAAQQVTTAHRARRAAIAWRAEGGFGEPFAMLLLAPDGYRYLGFTDGQLPQPYDRFRPGVGRREFLRGMKGPSPEVASGIGDDPPYAEWEAPYQRAIHAMILLADDDEHRLDGTVADVCASLSGVFEELTIERGKALKRKFTTRGERELTIEHFGFQDGVSQPIVVQQDLDAELTRRGGTQWNPGAPLSLALAQEPRASDGYGSFMVFRKLEQNVKAFWEAVDALHGQLVTEQPTLRRDDVGALAVGRYPDGIPTVAAAPIHEGADHNDFHFDSDPDGRRCPFQHTSGRPIHAGTSRDCSTSGARSSNGRAVSSAAASPTGTAPTSPTGARWSRRAQASGCCSCASRRASTSSSSSRTARTATTSSSPAWASTP